MPIIHPCNHLIPLHIFNFTLMNSVFPLITICTFISPLYLSFSSLALVLFIFPVILYFTPSHFISPLMCFFSLGHCLHLFIFPINFSCPLLHFVPFNSPHIFHSSHVIFTLMHFIAIRSTICTFLLSPLTFYFPPQLVCLLFSPVILYFSLQISFSPSCILFLPLALSAPFVSTLTFAFPSQLLCLLFPSVILYFTLSHFVIPLMHFIFSLRHYLHLLFPPFKISLSP